MDHEKLEEHLGTTRAAVQAVQRPYVELFLGCERVLDLACGPGHFLDLLRASAVRAWGVDSDGGAVQRCQAEGLDAVAADVLQYVDGLTAGSVPALFSAHLLEHLSPEDASRLLGACHRALAPGGLLVLATPNARALWAHLESFHAHPGHVRFYHPELVRHLVLSAGFSVERMGENPPGNPLFGNRLPRIRQLCQALETPRGVAALPAGESQRAGLRRWVRNKVLGWMAPWIDQLSREMAELGRFSADVAERLDRPPESFLVAKK